MKRLLTKGISLLLALSLIAGVMPGATVKLQAADTNIYTLSNGYLTVTLNGKNGGFLIKTESGDILNKDDNNKNLLFPDGLYDTSFTSIRVTRGVEVKEYIFGRSYGFLGWESSQVTTNNDGTTLTSEWSVDDIKVTQAISLVSSGGNEHGMARISYDVANNGAEAEIELRLLLDTALGYQDYAYYELPDAGNTYTRVESERVVAGGGYEKSFFAYDDPFTPTITAFLVNAPVDGAECKPTSVAFGHWNNLAATVFDFTPDPELTFTNPFNKRYLTADSAFALYYNAGTVQQGTAKTALAAYYGVYSNEKVQQTDRISVNITSPEALLLDADSGNQAFENGGKFSISTKITNFVSETAASFAKLAVAVYPASGITPLDSKGNTLSEAPTYSKPYNITYLNLEVGGTQTTNWHFKADVDSEAGYRKVEYRVFDISASEMLLQEKQVGGGYAYILCPGGDGKLPEIQFTSGTPEIIYNSGTRHIYLTGKNLGMLAGRGSYDLYARRLDNGALVKLNKDLMEINENEGTLHVVLTEPLAVGTYELLFDYTDVSKTDLTAPALRFTVSDDIKYRNDGYGIVAVVQDNQEADNNKITYSIQAFANEVKYAAEKSAGVLKDKEILLEFRGEFAIKKDVAGTIVSAVATSLGSSDPVVINNCLDFEKGSISIIAEHNRINVDFDGELWTSGARTSVWRGVAGFTSLENGADYDLIVYDENGDRANYDLNHKKISLIWPSAASVAQTIAGMVFDFRYGELGIMGDDPGTRVISFGAEMDLSFLVPPSQKREPNLSTMDEMHLLLFGKGTYSADELREIDSWRQADKEAKEAAQQEKGTTKVAVEDILFGGKYIGFKCEVALGLPSYTAAMPQMQGVLNINTIGDWAAGFAGKGSLTKFEMEFEIQLRSYNNIPIPDKMYFFIAGFVPGINVDGFGVLWLQGGGGGIDKLYETIFGTGSLPPLTLLLSAQIAILQIIEARADISLSLHGFGLEISDGKLAGVEGEWATVLNKANLRFDWYPDFYFMASANFNILQIINGMGYIVVEKDGFFEFFLRAVVSVPDKVPLIGGLKAGSVDLGASAQRVWGVAEVIGVKFGVVYYWGGDVSFTGGDSAPKPKYPELLAVRSSFPAGIDPVTGNTLYMQLGDNVQLVASNSGSGITKLANVATNIAVFDLSTGLKSSLDKKSHEIVLPTYDGNDAVISIEFTADSAEVAKSAVSIAAIGGTPYPLRWLDTTKDADHKDNATANAYLRYDPVTKLASLTVSFIEASFGNTWKITTTAAADIALYSIENPPQITGLSFANGTATWNGNDLGKLSEISFFAVSQNGADDVLVYKKVGNVDVTTATFTMPDTLPSGEYKLKAVASAENRYISIVETAGTFTHTNAAQPNVPGTITAENAGDHYIGVNITAPVGGSGYDGYVVNIYEKQSDDAYSLSPYGGLVLDKDTTEATVGGSYQSFDQEGKPVTRGLSAGATYKIGVAAYKDTDNGVRVLSVEAVADDLVLATPNRPVVSITSEQTSLLVNGINTFASAEVIFTLNTTQRVKGFWTLDGGEKKDIAFESTIPLKLIALGEGEHLIFLQGRNEAGDGVVFQYIFAVDSKAPRLVISSPLSGSLFTERSLTITGLTDPNTILHISANGKTLYSETPSLDANGIFSVDLTLSEDAIQNISVTARDAVGNAETVVLSLASAALSRMTGLAIYHGAEDVTNKVCSEGSVTGLQLSLYGVFPDDSVVDLSGHPLVEWDAKPVAGTAAVDSDGKVNVGVDARGIITARMLVAEGGFRVASTIFGATDTNSSQPDEQLKLLLSISPTAAITGVASGVAKTAAALGLPATVTMITQAGSVAANVLWDVASCSYDPDATAAQTFTVNGTALLPSDVINTNNISLVVCVRVTVDAAQSVAYTVTFNPNSGSVSPETVQTGADGRLASLPTPTRSGAYSFDGWFTQQSGGTKITTDYVFDADTIVYARWRSTGGWSSGSGTGGGSSVPGESNVSGGNTVSGGSGTGGDSIVSPGEETKPIPPPEEAMVADITINGETVQAQVSEDGVLTLFLSGNRVREYADISGAYDIAITEFKNISLRISIAALEGDSLRITTDFGIITIPNSSLQILREAYGDELRLVITEGSFKVALLDAADNEVSYQDPAHPLLITLPYTLGEGQKPGAVVAVNQDGAIFPCGIFADGWITFTTAATGTFRVIYNHKSFADVSSHWAQDAIDFVAARGLYSGIGNDLFAPDRSMTRAMFASVLARLDGGELGGYTVSPFNDVPEDAWYAASVAWAADQGIVAGVGDGRFDPNAEITREQVAAMLQNYLKHKGYATPEGAAEAFADETALSPWAYDAVKTIQRMGIIGGRPGNVFDPQGTATRAEVAAIFARFVGYVAPLLSS